MAFEQATSYLFGFSYKGVDLFPIKGDWDIANQLHIPWSDISSFTIKKGLLENEMYIKTTSMNIVMKLNKTVVNNPWIKDNYQNLEKYGYFL